MNVIWILTQTKKLFFFLHLKKLNTVWIFKGCMELVNNFKRTIILQLFLSHFLEMQM